MHTVQERRRRRLLEFEVTSDHILGAIFTDIMAGQRYFTGVRALLEWDPNVAITEDIFLDVLRLPLYVSGDVVFRDLITLFAEHNKQLLFSEQLPLAINQQFSHHSQKWLKDLCYTLEKTTPHLGTTSVHAHAI